MKKIKLKMLNSLLERALGLIGSEKAFPVLLNTRFGIHTFAMRYPIDILILDDKDRVVKLRKNLGPNKIFIWNPKFKKVIELPSGFIADKKIDIGDKLDLDLE